MKKLFVAIIILTMIMLLGCGLNSLSEENIYINPERIKKVYGSSYEQIFVDTETNVMYLYEGLGYGGGLTVMVDKNGKPLLWEGGDEE